ncbi:MAG: hypothetical protein AAGC85_21040 [Bacteroidota bacterium]
MDFRIIQFLDYQFFGSKKDAKGNILNELTEEEEKVMADYHFIIRAYIQWEKEEFSRKIALWEQEEAMSYEIRPYSFRLCA